MSIIGQGLDSPGGRGLADSVSTTFDIDALRAKYRAERDRRVRPGSGRQYRGTTGEFGYYAKDPYTERAERAPVHDRVEATVVGGGFGGLQTAARLRDAGLREIRMIDEAGDFGGTWYWNRYPGIHCDIEATIYMPLLEEVGYVPKWRYAPGEEIRQHAVAIAEHYDLYARALFHTKAVELTLDDDGAEWIVRTDRGDEFRSRYVVVSSGLLTQAKLPAIPGIGEFRGHTFHTSRWDYGYTGGDLSRLAGRKVGVVGTGATGVQVVPHLAESAERLYVFQRTPSTVDVRDNRPTDPSFAASLRPGWQRERMDNFLTVVSGGHADVDLIDDGWTGTARLQRTFLTGTRDELTDEELELADFAKMNEIRARVDRIVEDPETAEKLKPWYRYMCKRPTFSDHYLQAFNRPNVTLVDTADHGGITRMTETSVVVGDDEYEVDCVIFATGFEVGISGVLSGTLTVTGRDGRNIFEHWSKGFRTLHGFFSHGFPNLFHLGPIHNANAVNFVHILHEQAVHIGALVATGARRIEPTLEAEDAWSATIEANAHDSYRFQAACTPGYYNNEGDPMPAGFSFGPGPIAFHDLLRTWRTDGSMDGVLWND